MALQYQFSARHIDEYHFGDVSAGDVSLGELLSLQFPHLIDSLGRDQNKSTITLSGTFSNVDDLGDPRRGWVVRPAAEITVPAMRRASAATITLTTGDLLGRNHERKPSDARSVSVRVASTNEA